MSKLIVMTSAAAYSTHRLHLSAVDGLLGFAMLAMLLFHAGDLPGGALGVNLFLALASYLETDMVLREARETGRVSPAGVCNHLRWHLLPRGTGSGAVAGFVNNLVLPALAVTAAIALSVTSVATHPEMFEAALTEGPGWNLNLHPEEIFTLGWVATLVIVARSTRSADNVAAVLAGAALVAVVIFLDDTHGAVFAVVAGALFATLPVQSALVRFVDGAAGPVSTLLAAGTGVTWILAAPMVDRGSLYLCTLATCTLIALCVGAPRTPLAKGLSWLPLRCLGLTAYSMYLWCFLAGLAGLR